MFELTEVCSENLAKIKVIGVGGGGGNAVNTMIASCLQGVDFINANTDAQALGVSSAPVKIQIGSQITKGLGAGSDPEIGKQSALESRDEIRPYLEGADMIFITAGMGGGTGTGAAPVIAEIARECSILTIAVVTKPFQFEGKKRNMQAEEGIEQLREKVDTLIVVPNQRLLSLGGRNLSLLEAFKKADDILYQAVKGISDLILVPGLINLDFADVRSVMSNMGMAIMGTGIASGENRAVEAAQRAISSPLLEDNTIQGAHGILLNITGGSDMSLYEVNEASSLIQEEADEDANIIFGTVIDQNMEDEIRITVIATGFDDFARKKNDSVGNVTRFRGVGGREDLATPTFIRRERKLNSGEIAVVGLGDETENMDIQIPTFLRRQAD
ncbi:MAG TPA: cell division protein FtsZ [Smithella sp.]|jgi:cell division protein FtsZ|nr:cell division protein FtsZ [Smithella sp.]NMC97103.1 cell division protein FtsZ [Deltaproteobacteria bacterium]OQC52763.1 MAG: Cell division protein FtsZ [Deltaproteobacteria bacterium ADurb.Bin022]HNQ66565.1 cell division protein FtsZ [Smithella sp.]HOE31711.1 cell division protein FtsZ [Smithella sp.]